MADPPFLPVRSERRAYREPCHWSCPAPCSEADAPRYQNMPSRRARNPRCPVLNRTPCLLTPSASSFTSPQPSLLSRVREPKTSSWPHLSAGWLGFSGQALRGFPDRLYVEREQRFIAAPRSSARAAPSLPCSALQVHPARLLPALARPTLPWLALPRRARCDSPSGWRSALPAPAANPRPSGPPRCGGWIRSSWPAAASAPR